MMVHGENWERTKKRFEAWWNQSSLGRPMMRIIARRETPLKTPEEEETPDLSPEDIWLNVAENARKTRNYIRTHRYLAEAYPEMDVNLGPGSLAIYLGSEPVFTPDTVWYKPVIDDFDTFGPLQYDPDNHWWKKHLGSVRQAVSLAGGDFIVNIPDLLESIDILSAMRDPQKLCYDLIDRPDIIESYIDQLDELYFIYYDAMYDAVKAPDGSCSYTAFSIWGPGKTAKVQCDFSALISPAQFCRFVQPSLIRQCRKLDYSMYHLDGPDAIRHLDALMEIEDLNALQWTPGAGQPDGGSEQWFPIYDKVKKAGKSLWISICDGDIRDWTRKAEGLYQRYGSDGLYLLFPVMSEKEADGLLNKAEKEWHSSAGTYH